RTERWRDLAELCERRLDRDPHNRAAIWYRLGSVSLDHLGDPVRAIECLREVLSADGSHSAAVAALERIMGDPEHRGAAAEILEPVFLARMEWPKVTAALEARLATEAEQEARRDIFRRLGRIHEEYLEDLEGALEVYARLFREDIGDKETRDMLAR